MSNGFPKWLTNLFIVAIVLLPIWVLQLSFQRQAPPPARNEVIFQPQKKTPPRVLIHDAVGALAQAGKAEKSERKASIPALRSYSAQNTYVANQDVARNAARGDNSLAASGKTNIAQGDHTTIGGGQQNVASKWESTVSGGSGNQATEIGTVVSGGKDNQSGAVLASIGGGRFNQASGVISRIGGGANNRASAIGTVISGGKANQAAGNYGTIAGGVSNRTDTGYAGVLSGEGNMATGLYSIATGGLGNQSGGTASTIAGGKSNVTIDVYTTIGGGILNFARGYAATIAGGAGNGVLGDQASVGGGWNNLAFGSFSAIPGGEENLAKGNYSLAAGKRAQAVHEGAFVWADPSGEALKSSQKNQFTARASGGFRMLSSSDGRSGVELAAGSGSWSSLSSREVKDQLESVNSVAILETIASLKLHSWHYQTEAPDTRHLGPMAEDFHAAFGLGDSNRRISTVDADGVALAGIQALYEEVQALKQSVADLQNENQELRNTLGQKNAH